MSNVIKNQIELLHIHKIDNSGTFEIKGFENPEYRIFKVRKIACMSLKGKGCHSGLRIIYAYNESKAEVIFLEIYYKGDKENEKSERIKDFLKNYY